MNHHNHTTTFNPFMGLILMVTEPYTIEAFVWIIITLLVMWAGGNLLDVLFKKTFRMALAKLKKKLITYFKNERNRG